MIFLKNFQLMDEDVHFQSLHSIYKSLCSIYNNYTPDEYYPLGLFNPSGTGQRIKNIDFEDITIFYGGNGSGKTTLLNIIAEKIDAFRNRKHLQTEAFTYYISECEYEYDEKPLGRKFLASDDIFEHILNVREENKSLKSNKIEEANFHYECKRDSYRSMFPGGVKLDFESEDRTEFEKLAHFSEARKKTRRQFVRSRAGEMQRQYSNGENALMFFDKTAEIKIGRGKDETLGTEMGLFLLGSY